MSIKHSLASKKRWKKISKIDRASKMAQLAISKWNSLTPAQQKKHIKKNG
jgi:hypothetical protein